MTTQEGPRDPDVALSLVCGTLERMASDKSMSPDDKLKALAELSQRLMAAQLTEILKQMAELKAEFKEFQEYLPRLVKSQREASRLLLRVAFAHNEATGENIKALKRCCRVIRAQSHEPLPASGVSDG